MPRSYPKLGAVFFYLAFVLEFADGGGHRGFRENGIGYLGNGRDGIDIRGWDRSSASYSVGDKKR